MSTVIQVHDLWKKYRLGMISTGTVAHDLNRWWARVRGKADPYAKVGDRPDKAQSQASEGLGDDEIWALRGVSLEVEQGEILGIIGRNGAGKSTLLKIVSRTTAPTKGEVRVKGRIASLLEVGTGFHPDLTGRENVFLNGAILGMTKAEIRRKFDEIVAFAEVTRFIDTPVKRYSSGMYVRLAFAVAAHLEPEVLIVDEVLAVGDAEFQKKCLGKMQDVATKEGRTVLFVSHNMAAVRRLCSRGILFAKGEVLTAGPIGAVVDAYIRENENRTDEQKFNLRHKSKLISLESVNCLKNPARFGDPLELLTTWEAVERTSAAIECVIKDGAGNPIAFYGTGVTAGFELEYPAGRHEVKICFPSLPLAEGRYFVDLIAAKTNKEFLVYAEDALKFEIQESDPCGSGLHFAQGNGSVFFPCEVTSSLRRI